MLSFCLGFVALAELALSADQYFFEQLVDERNIAYESKTGPSRLSMIEEMGQKYPGKDCSNQCGIVSKIPYYEKACRLGMFGSIYLFTGFQKRTGRSEIDIWQTPNYSLNIAPYAFMKERENGVSCEYSHFIRKFPTRVPKSGESSPPLSHLDVCRAWNAYFDASDASTEKRVARVSERGASQSSAPKDSRTTSENSTKINLAQSLLWEAHTKALLHSYWQYKEILSWGDHVSVPLEEYEMWMAWSRIVGTWAPRMNNSTCVEDATVIAYQLFPDCILGRKRSGITCSGSEPPNSGMISAIKSMGIKTAQSLYRSGDLSKTITEFVKHLPEPTRTGAPGKGVGPIQWEQSSR